MCRECRAVRDRARRAAQRGTIAELRIEITTLKEKLIAKQAVIDFLTREREMAKRDRRG